MKLPWDWRQLKKNQWLIILLVGILLMVIVWPTEKKDLSQEKQSKKTKEEQTDAFQWIEYENYIEEKLEGLLSQVKGAGKVEVMVALAGTKESVIEKDIPQEKKQIEESDKSGGSRTTTENNWQESTVYIQNNGTSQPYVSKELAPEIQGICVLAQGGESGTVAQSITEAIQALFSIDAHKIKVMTMK